jgi:hypothetical protein
MFKSDIMDNYHYTLTSELKNKNGTSGRTLLILVAKSQNNYLELKFKVSTRFLHDLFGLGIL